MLFEFSDVNIGMKKTDASYPYEIKISAQYLFFVISCYKGHYNGLKLKIFLNFCFSAVDFFNQVNLLYGTLTEFCTSENCPTMSAGPKYVAASFISLISALQIYMV